MIHWHFHTNGAPRMPRWMYIMLCVMFVLLCTSPLWLLIMALFDML